MSALLYIWQLPQHLLAQVIYWLLLAMRKLIKPQSLLFRPNELIEVALPNFGLCLGEYIFIGYKDINGYIAKHEQGHRIQSRYFGPFYLFIVGLPSVSRNIWQRIFKKSTAWYYSGWPEYDANKRAGLV